MTFLQLCVSLCVFMVNIQTITSLSLNFSSPVYSNSNSCGTWTTTGQVTLTPADQDVYLPSLFIQTSSQDGNLRLTNTVCSINLNSCLYASSYGDICACVKRTGNVREILVKQQARTSHSTKMLEAALRSTSVNHQTVATVEIGQLPEVQVSDVDVTFSVNGDDRQTLQPRQNIAVCNGKYSTVDFQTASFGQKILMKVTVNGQVTMTNRSVIYVTEKFDFSSRQSFTLEFHYDEMAGCRVTKSATIDVIEKTLGCDDVTDSSCNNTDNSVTQTTQAPPQDTPCMSSSSSLPRQIETLPSGVQGLCDTTTDGGGWVIFQRRNTTSFNFNRNWDNYTQGFGDLQGDFWLGLDNIHSLCNESNSSQCQLRLEIKVNGSLKHAQYDNFYISGKEDFYRLHVANYSGDAGDNLLARNQKYRVLDGMRFSTFDSDNDEFVGNCASSYQGGWWYNACHWGNLNAPLDKRYKVNNWIPWSKNADLQLTEMKLRLK